MVLSLGCQAGDLEMVKIMIDKYQCDPNGEREVKLSVIIVPYILDL